MGQQSGRDGGGQQQSAVNVNVGDKASIGTVAGVINGGVHVHKAPSGNSAAVLVVGTSPRSAQEAPLEDRWRAGEEGWLGDRRYLLWGDSAGLIREYRDPRDGRVRRQAIARQIDPEQEAGQSCVWLRHGGGDLTRERDLLARALAAKTGRTAARNGSRRRQGSGFPHAAYYHPGPGAVTLALSWPSEKDGLPAEALGVRFPPGSLDKWRVSLLLAGVRGLVTTLERLHRLGVSHRNLSPESIIVTGRGQWALRDLGLAAVPFRPGERPESYQAPEQAAGSRLPKPSPATDVYQLAAVLYHLVTGRIPGRNSPPARHEGLPGPVTDIIAAALAARPADRPGTHDLRMALNEPGATVQPET